MIERQGGGVSRASGRCFANRATRGVNLGRAEFEAKTQPMYEEFCKLTGGAGRDLVKYVGSVRF